jgi:hypothetical protein
MKKNQPDFLTYLSSLSVSLAAAAGGIVAPATAAAAPVSDVQAELRLSPEAVSKLVTVAERTLSASQGKPNGDKPDGDKMDWWLFARAAVSPDSDQRGKVEPGALSFIETLAQVKS